MRKIRLVAAVICCAVFTAVAQSAPRFKALVLSENGGNHTAYTKMASLWIDSLAKKDNFLADYVQDTRKFTRDFLSQYQLIIQLDFPPYGWRETEMDAFREYIEQGQGGWIGFHHATLLGDFDGYKMWPWFSEFMGGIRFKTYIPGFASATVNVEANGHPLFKGLPRKFTIKKEEWYTYDKSPRTGVQVLASVDEDSYQPAAVPKMGDHPVIWTNPHMKARNVYLFMGHGPDLFENIYYKQLFKNAIYWSVKPYLKK